MSLKDKEFRLSEVHTYNIKKDEVINTIDIKKAIIEFEIWLNDNVIYVERERLFNKFKEIFGDWEK